MQPQRHYGAISTPSQISLGQVASSQRLPSDTTNRPLQEEPWRAKVLITGMRRSGKTSIQEVVFNSLPPKDTFFLEGTTRITKLDIDSIVAFQLWDCPGEIPLDALGVPLSYFSSIIFVLDIQDDYHYPIAYLVNLIATIARVHPSVHLEVFVHKAEALSDEFKVEHFRHIQSRIIDELLDHPDSSKMTNLPLNFYLTSVYDHTIYEAVSRVVQRLVPQLSTLEELLNTLGSNSGIAKSFLFDITCLVYVATDYSPVDNASFELCCDYVQTLASFSNLYKNLKPKSPPTQASIESSSSSSSSQHAPRKPKPRPKAPRRHPPNADDGDDEESPSSSPSHSLISTTKSDGSSPTTGVGRNGSQRSKSTNGKSAVSGKPNSIDKLLPPDEESTRWASSSAKLTPESTLAYWQITDTLALVCLIRSQTFEERRGLIEYNVAFFRGAVHRVVKVELAKRHGASTS